ncbi:RodZ domain-containing protein [Immundisolibacter sp.]
MTSRDSDTEAAPAAPSTGEQLRSARVARGWSAQEVAGRLRIRPAFIEALEREDYAPFGAAAYARGQLRNYARLLGLDDEALLQGFKSPAGDSPGKPLRRAPELHPGRPRLVRVGGLAIVLVLVVLGALWAGAGRGPQAPLSEPSTTPPAPPELNADWPPVAGLAPESPLPEATAGVPPGPSVTEPAVVLAEPALEANPTAPENTPPSAASRSPAQDVNDTNVELRLRSRSVSWVEVTDHSGRRLLYELVSPGPERTVRGQPPLRLLLGNAPAVDVLYNGAPVSLPAGQHVVRMTLGTAPPQPAPASSGAPASGPVPPAPVP